ncbi:MAG: hypothetical protein K8F36_11550 [Melioribacteraceae bacterium]|nr:hypothetical protein [Melioribacteraceae bacterium]
MILQKSKYLFFFLLILIYGCGASNTSVFKNDVELGPVVYSNKEYGITMRLPSGWEILKENECNCTKVWIVRNDYGASLNLSRIYLDHITNEEIQKAPIEILLAYIKTLKAAEMNGRFAQIGKNELFKIGSRDYGAIIYYGKNNMPVRSIIFKHKNYFYQFDAYVTEPGIGNKLLPDEVYSIQNAVLASVE